ncbi:MAG TPA: HEAT repeat domain-containing protein [Dehalococcoidia bacterium]|nr:HEAT repeat domain-containing protein [Dehalococcoidia bacterium]
MESIEELARALSDGSAEGRAAAAEALGKIRDVRAVQALITALTDDDPLVRWTAVAALRETEEGRGVMAFIEATLEASNRY